jgi:hypothetical protein
LRSDAPHILLINPWIHDFAAYDVWAKPLGLLTLAAILREHGCRLTYIDCLDRVMAFTGWRSEKRFKGDHLDTYPFPAFDLQHRISYVPLVTTRGCPFACACGAKPCRPRATIPPPIRFSPTTPFGPAAKKHSAGNGLRN